MKCGVGGMEELVIGMYTGEVGLLWEGENRVFGTGGAVYIGFFMFVLFKGPTSFAVSKFLRFRLIY